jgi:hypothetical protein
MVLRLAGYSDTRLVSNLNVVFTSYFTSTTVRIYGLRDGSSHARY